VFGGGAQRTGGGGVPQLGRKAPKVAGKMARNRFGMTRPRRCSDLAVVSIRRHAPRPEPPRALSSAVAAPSGRRGVSSTVLTATLHDRGAMLQAEPGPARQRGQRRPGNSHRHNLGKAARRDAVHLDGPNLQYRQPGATHCRLTLMMICGGW
jgi:hypothetical protein